MENSTSNAKLGWPTRVLNVLFGCRHRDTGFPVTRKGECYVVCVKCGTMIPYDWENMRRAG